MKGLMAAVSICAIAGCASVTKVEMDSGEKALGERLTVTLDGSWNHLSAPNMGPAQVWTMEGLPIDQLQIYAGIKNEQLIHREGAGGATRKNFAFRSSMQPDEIVALFEGMLTRDGSSFRLLKLEPANFGGEKGFRFEYSLTLKSSNVELSGVGYGTVSKGELFALLYMAPRLGFFARQQPRVEQIARSARLKI